MLRQRSTPAVEATVVGLLVLVCLASGIGLSPILNGDEARFAQASREMFLNRDWVVPTFGGQPRYDKPILIYWVTAGSFRVFGVTPWAARLPSALAAALCAALLAWSARHRWGPGSGLIAGLLLAASPIFFFEGRTCTADAINLLWTLVAMLALEQLLTGRATRMAAATFWTATGLAVLTKGPVAPLFIGSTLIGLWAFGRSWNVWQGLLAAVLVMAGAVAIGPALLVIPAVAALVSALRRAEVRSRLKVFRWLWGVPLFLAVTLPWAIAAWHATSGEFFTVAIGRHVLERGQAALEGHSGFPGFYLATAVVLCFPWLAIALHAGANAWKRHRDDPGHLFLLAWGLGPLIALELVQTKLVHYWLPSYPALILLAVGWLWTPCDRFLPRGLVLLHLLGGCMLAAIPIIPALVLNLPGLKTPALVISGPLLVVTIFTASTLTRRYRPSIWVSAGGTLIFLMLLFGPFLSRLSNSFIGTRATAVARGHLKHGRSVALYGLRDEEMLFSLPLDTKVHRTPEKLESAPADGQTTVYCARERDFLRILGAADRGPFEVIDRVEGLDLGRGRVAATVFFIPREEQR
ncbi:MAG: glycosyltransferase family 39 protein [Acidobacteria bacterium]|nr:glycosyltransferase family 39 protein [Acidobacteriota bacterium]